MARYTHVLLVICKLIHISQSNIYINKPTIRPTTAAHAVAAVKDLPVFPRSSGSALVLLLGAGASGSGSEVTSLQHKALSVPVLSQTVAAHKVAVAVLSALQPAAHVMVLHAAFCAATRVDTNTNNNAPKIFLFILTFTRREERHKI